MSGVREAALAYAAMGWSVIPIRRGDKRPALGTWERFQERPAGAAEISKFFPSRSGLNVAVVTGMVSGLMVLDVDGDLGRRSLQGLPMPETVVCETPHGAHYYFAHPGTRVRNAVKLKAGIDIRGDGGYVVAPPSGFDGTEYSWLAGHAPGQLPLAPPPAWLLSSGPDKGVAVTDWRALTSAEVPSGMRNNTVAKIAGLLLRCDVDPYVALDLVASWNQVHCSPPLDTSEVTRVVDSIAGLELQRRKGQLGDD